MAAGLADIMFEETALQRAQRHTFSETRHLCVQGLKRPVAKVYSLSQNKRRALDSRSYKTGSKASPGDRTFFSQSLVVEFFKVVLLKAVFERVKGGASDITEGAHCEVAWPEPVWGLLIEPLVSPKDVKRTPSALIIKVGSLLWHLCVASSDVRCPCADRKHQQAVPKSLPFSSCESLVRLVLKCPI